MNLPFPGRRSILGRADLVAAIATDNPQLLATVAAQLGLQYQPPRHHEPEIARSEGQQPESAFQHPDTSGYPAGVPGLAQWLVTGYQAQDPLELPQNDHLPCYHRWTSPPAQTPQSKPLAPWSMLRSRLHQSLGILQQGHQVDIPKLVSLVARRELIHRFPRLSQRRWNGQLVIVQDWSFRLATFEQDQQTLIREFRKLLSSQRVDVVVGQHPEQLRRHRELNSWDEEDISSMPFDQPAPGSRVLVLGDLGILSTSQSVEADWFHWGRRLKRAECQLLALVPCGLQRVPSRFHQLFALQSWQRDPAAFIKDQSQRREVVQRLFKLLAP